MFSGIIEEIGIIESFINEGSNITFGITSDLAKELKIDQSVSHNGVCLTVVNIEENIHYVNAVEETLLKSNLGNLGIGDEINLERGITMNTRLDGHMVQGHVDATVQCTRIENKEGSWLFEFAYNAQDDGLLVDKGSICINGVSLTIVQAKRSSFEVAIIPYTFEHTTFKSLEVGDSVNIEFDIIGKYVLKYMQKVKMG